jgi:sortase A
MRKIATILMIIGALIALSPLVGQWYTKYQENKMMEEWLNSVDAEPLDEAVELDPEEALSQLSDAFLPENSQQGSEAAATTGESSGAAGEALEGTADESDGEQGGGTGGRKESEASKQTVLGIIQIKKIKVKAPVVEGVKPSNLKSAVGHVPGTAALGQPGNSALAGHRSYTFGKFFNRLDEIVVGDEILITTKKEDLTYKVIKTHVVTPDDVSVLRGSKDDNIITLITCTPIYVASHRLIVVARLENRVLKEP